MPLDIAFAAVIYDLGMLLEVFNSFNLSAEALASFLDCSTVLAPKVVIAGKSCFAIVEANIIIVPIKTP